MNDDASGSVVWEDNHAKVVRHYLSSWFALDFLCAFPFDAVLRPLARAAHRAVAPLRLGQPVALLLPVGRLGGHGEPARVRGGYGAQSRVRRGHRPRARPRILRVVRALEPLGGR